MGTRITQYELKYALDFGGDEGVATFVAYFDTLGQLMYHAARMYAFDDCEPVEILSIMANGRELKYCGWRPGMEFTFYDKETHEEVWSECFPHWDH